MPYKFCVVGLLCLSFLSCKKVIDLYPISNINSGSFYSNASEVKAGVLGCYNSLQTPQYREWQLTELRTDNALMGVTGSTSTVNRDLSDLDMFIPATTHAGIYGFWRDTYNGIRTCNSVLQKLGVIYDVASGTSSLADINIPLTDAERKQFAGEVMFIRAHYYFNLVRLFGGVFLVHKPITPAESKTMSRASKEDIYKLVESDLQFAATNLNAAKYNVIPSDLAGRANAWAAKGLLAKVYLTLNRKAEAITLLQDVMSNSGYALQGNYASVFAITSELNSEILFTVRYKAGGFGLGSSFGNDFGPLNSGSVVINGSGRGWNTPSTELDTAYVPADTRRNVSIAFYGVGTAADLYVKKYLFPVALTDDGESDWPILRYADILLMMAEAKGFTPESITLINAVRTRAGLPAYIATDLPDIASFEQALSNERRLEFAFENQRWYDLVRYNTTLSTINAEATIKAHFAHMYAVHYGTYVAPTPTLAELQSNVTANRLLLPIPQHEIDTNTQLAIEQNPGY